MADHFRQALRNFLAYLRIECGLAANSLLAYEDDLNQLFEYCIAQGLTGPSQLDGALFIAHLRDLRANNLASSTIARHLATLRSFGRYLAHNQITPTDPSELLERPATWRKVPKAAHLKHIQALLEAPDPETDTLYHRDLALIETLYATGCRASEIGTIECNDLHNDLGVIKITGKGNRQRLVPIGKPALAAIHRYLSEQRPQLLRPNKPTDRLFITERGTPVDRFVIFAVVRKYARRAGLNNVHPHTLRHTFATHLLSGGADLRAVQEMLGHARVTTTQLYTHIDQDRLRKVINSHHPRP